MKINEVFYILYVQQNGDKKANKLIVFYSKETLQPIYAYILDWHNRIPKEYVMLEYITITLKQYKSFVKSYDDMGILQAYGRGIPEGEK